MKKLLISVVAVTFLVATAEARRDQGREQRQQNRIKQGGQSDSLTKKEAKKLRKGQHRIDKMQKKAMADGQVSDEEKARLEKAQDRQSKKIYKFKHNEHNRKGIKSGAPNGTTPAASEPSAVPVEGSDNNE